MGTFALGRCYEDQSDAVSALFSYVAPSLQDGCITSLSFADSVWSVSKTCDQTTISYPAPIPSLLSCNPADSINDGVLLGFAMGAVWIGVWAVKVIRRAL